MCIRDSWWSVPPTPSSRRPWPLGTPAASPRTRGDGGHTRRPKTAARVGNGRAPPSGPRAPPPLVGR
eukprot:8334314-Alexandrium_andersonii.AAC.1